VYLTSINNIDCLHTRRAKFTLHPQPYIYIFSNAKLRNILIFKVLDIIRKTLQITLIYTRKLKITYLSHKFYILVVGRS